MSQLGVGSTFTFIIPATEGAEAKVTEQANRSGSGKILIMDDSELIRAAFRTLLVQLGFKVVSTENGEEAVEAFEAAVHAEKPFDLAILDLTIPNGMGGKETSERLLEHDPQIKMIVASGYAHDSIMASYDDFGFSGALLKPFTRRDLLAMIESVMGINTA